VSVYLYSLHWYQVILLGDRGRERAQGTGPTTSNCKFNALTTMPHTGKVHFVDHNCHLSGAVITDRAGIQSRPQLKPAYGL